MIQYSFDTDREYQEYNSILKDEKQSYQSWKNNL